MTPHYLGLYGAAPTHGSRGQEEEAGAKGVSKLYQGRIRKRDMAVFLGAALLVVAIVVVVLTPPVFRQGVGLVVRDFIRSLTD